MTFLDEAKTHIGRLIRIKTELYWYDAPRYGLDGDPGRICLLLDTQPCPARPSVSASPELPVSLSHEPVVVLLFIDGMPRWILVWADIVEHIE